MFFFTNFCATFTSVHLWRSNFQFHVLYNSAISEYSNLVKANGGKEFLMPSSHEIIFLSVYDYHQPVSVHSSLSQGLICEIIICCQSIIPYIIEPLKKAQHFVFTLQDAINHTIFCLLRCSVAHFCSHKGTHRRAKNKFRLFVNLRNLLRKWLKKLCYCIEC